MGKRKSRRQIRQKQKEANRLYATDWETRAAVDRVLDTSLRPRPGETAEETVDRVIEAVRHA